MSTTIINQSLRFSERVKHIPKSFIREILKITAQPDVISFAGGLPNPSSFPVEAIKQSAMKVLDADGRSVMQYAPSEGYLPLRQWIADRYAKKGMNVKIEEILITNGSQQGLDLTGKIFINEGDSIIVEQPSYLGAIQAFSAYRPKFHSVPLLEEGIDANELQRLLNTSNAKFFYAIPNFQNPTGLSYSNEKKKIVADIINDSNSLLLEDDPYGEIKFNHTENQPIKKHIGNKGILLGSFSKIISPGMRLGWIVAAPEIIEKLLVVKQAADLHSNFLSQRVIYQYLQDYNIDRHIETIIDIYEAQKDHMMESLKTYMPEEVKYTNPDGGMFIWMTLPSRISAYTLLELASKEKVVFVPGEVFYTDTKFSNTLRLNYSNSNFEEIERGISILGRILKTLI
jgi:2-aminoadipate transaminase